MGDEAVIRLDHFVIHVDDDMSRLKQLKETIEPLGFPFLPERGKGTRSFKVSNIWVGEQYFEIVRIFDPDGDWRKDWASLYQSGRRGLFGIMLMTNELDEWMDTFRERGIPIEEPERISFRWLIFKKTLPWRTLFLPRIPGTDVQITISQMDSEKDYQFMKRFMKPNASEQGITGIVKATLHGDFSDEAWDYLKRLFPWTVDTDERLVFGLDEGHQLCFQKSKDMSPVLSLVARSEDPAKRGGEFQLENVRLRVE
jgi:hypothetical protein